MLSSLIINGLPVDVKLSPGSPPAATVEYPLHIKRLVLWIGILVTWNGNLGSSLPSGSSNEIATHFAVTKHTQIVLINSLYLVGYTIGPLVFGPLSEYIGRRPVLVGSYIGYLLFTLLSAASPRFYVLLISRTLCGIVAAAPNAVVGGLYADVFTQPAERGRAIAFFLTAATMGPPMGPIISGFTSSISWRLCFWIGLAISGLWLPLVVLLPETYMPVLEQRRNRQKQATPHSFSAGHSQTDSTTMSGTRKPNIRLVFSRPFVMLLREPIVLFTSLYCALIYATLYLFFQMYPLIFTGLYGLSPSKVGLAYLPVLFGSILGLFISLGYDAIYARASAKEAAWTLKPEHRRLPLACVGGPMIALSLFWLGWTARISLTPALPMLSGLFFGMGYLLVFIAMLNYLTDAYQQFSASVHAAASTTRAMTAVALPFAALPMYDKLGVQWACSTIGFLATVMMLVPFVFIRYGSIIRHKSPFCRQLDRSLQNGSSP